MLKSTGKPALPNTEVKQRIDAAKQLRQAVVVLGVDDARFLIDRWQRPNTDVPVDSTQGIRECKVVMDGKQTRE